MRSGFMRFTMLIAAASFPGLVSSQSPTLVPAAPGAIRGLIFDSVHNIPLAGAIVLVDGVARIGQTGHDGRYLIDSIPAGSYRVSVVHPLLDTIGMALLTGAVPVRPAESVNLDLSIPSSEHIVSLLCPVSIGGGRGPAALIGQVRDPDSDHAATGAKVQLLYDDVSPIGIKLPSTLREATVDSAGGYTICGLPTPMTGKLQVFRNGIASGQVDLQIASGLLGLRSLTIAEARIAASVADSAGRVRLVAVGRARVTGRVVNKAGQPVDHARVSVTGSGSATVTGTRGEFALDSLPSGTQSLEVRKIGYGPTDQSVELSASNPASVVVTMNDYELPAVRVEADRDRALADLGYLDRKKVGFGYFLDGANLHPESAHFSDVIRRAPMLRVTPNSRGKYVIGSARDPSGGCVNFFVDGSRFKEMVPGDIDDYLLPSEVRAIEVFNPSSVPARFEASGSTKCVTVVIWTARSTNRPPKK